MKKVFVIKNREFGNQFREEIKVKFKKYKNYGIKCILISKIYDNDNLIEDIKDTVCIDNGLNREDLKELALRTTMGTSFHKYREKIVKFFLNKKSK
jgi:hypothetical protein